MAVSTRAASEMKRLIRIDYLLDSHHATQRGQLRVNGPDSAETGLPKFPREQTFAVLVGMSQTCR